MQNRVQIIVDWIVVSVRLRLLLFLFWGLRDFLFRCFLWFCCWSFGLCHVEAWLVVFAEYWIIVVNIMAEFMCLFMPGAVEWLNDAMAEIESMMLIMQIVVLMPEIMVWGMDVVMIRINVVVLLIVIIMMITMHFEMMGIVPLIVMAIFVPVSV